jgi:nucleoid-associated protein EbfC
MKDFGAIMKQAQAMQQKLAEAQERLEAAEVDGAAGGGAVKVVLKGSGELVKVDIDDALMIPGEADMVGDLVTAAHGDAKRKLDAIKAQVMQEAAGPLAGMPGMPKF